MGNKYPECDKLSSKVAESSIIVTFLEWCDENNISLVVSEPDEEGMRFIYNSEYNELMARYFDIDLKKVEQERREILDSLRDLQVKN